MPERKWECTTTQERKDAKEVQQQKQTFCKDCTKLYRKGNPSIRLEEELSLGVAWAKEFLDRVYQKNRC